MKTLGIIAYGLMIVTFTMAQVRDQSGIFAGLRTDMMNVPLSGNDIIAETGTVAVGYRFNNGFMVDLGWVSRLILDEVPGTYNRKNGVGLGLAYPVWEMKEKYSSIELQLDLATGKEFNYSAGAGIRWSLFDSFFLGSGIRYDHWDANQHTVSSSSAVNWYWQLGLRLAIGTEK